MKLLAVKCRQLGDSVLWTSALEATRQLFPQSTLDIALPASYAPLFDGDPRFGTVFALKCDGKDPSRFSDTWNGAQYDYALVFHANRMARSVALHSGAKRKLIHHHSRKGHHFGSDSPILHLGTPQPATQRDLNVLRTLGWDGAPPPTHIQCKPEWKELPLPQAPHLGFGPDCAVADGLTVFAPLASRAAKQWPLENYARAIELLSPRRPVAILAPNPEVWRNAEHFTRRVQGKAHWVFTPKLEQLVGFLSSAHAVVGSDSGVKHLAIALGVRTLTLFGPESVGEWHPYSQIEHPVLRRPVGCRSNDPEDPLYAWCGADVCPLASHACLSTLSPEVVVDAIERYL